MGYHFMPVTMTFIKKMCADINIEKKEPFFTVGGILNWCSHYRKQYGGSSKNDK